VAQTDPTGRRVEWTYDEAGRDAELIVDGRVVSSITRDLRNRRVVVADTLDPDRPVEHELVWDRRDRLVSRRRGDRRISWGYDADGRRTSMIGPDGRETRYTRDAAGRVTAVEHPALGRATFRYDGSGRLIEAGAGDLIQTWRHADGFVVEHTRTGPDGSARSTVQRDAWGRVVAVSDGAGRRGFDYDDAHQLIEDRR